MNQEEIGKYIKQLRKEKGLSQSELADKLGVTFQAVSKWENGKNLPDVQVLSLISKYFDVDIDSIITANKPNKKTPYLLLISLALIFISSLLLLLHTLAGSKDETTYKYHNVKEIKSKNTNYDVYGSVIQYDQYSTLVLNNMTYVGKTNQNSYKKITCYLYEEVGNNKTKLVECDAKNNITISEYLKTFKLQYDSNEKICPNYNVINYFLELVTTDKDDNNTIYQIPLIIYDAND